eukprot:3153576-Pyramimonas_sp.AAC.1
MVYSSSGWNLQSATCDVNCYGAADVVHFAWCHLCCPIYVARGATLLVQFVQGELGLSTALLHPPTRNLVCEIHVAAVASTRSARWWLVHLCGRAGPRMLARTAASESGATDAAEGGMTAGHAHRVLQSTLTRGHCSGSP